MTRRKRKSRAKSSLRNTSNLLIIVGVIGVIVLGAWYAMSRPDNSTGGSNARNQGQVQIPHLHGLSYSADGSQLIVPAHIGLVILENNGWSIPNIPAHDYMGYTGVDNGFFSSGHPDLRSDLVNPLGLVKSTDSGESVTVLDFMSETDFHFMAAGYHNHAIYVLNPQPNSRLSAGLHYTLDESETWQQSQLQGLEGSLTQIAVHPTDANSVAIATEAGLFLSDDFGDSFISVGEAASMTAVSFDPNGEALYFANWTLYRYDLTSQQIETLSIPSLAPNDFIAYIAANPASDELAIATFAKDIHLSRDSGGTWQQIAREGVGLEQ